MNLKLLRALEENYLEAGLLQENPLGLSSIRRKLKRFSDEISKEEIQELLKQYRVLPLVGELDVYKHELEHGTISQSQQAALEHFERIYQTMHRTKPTQQLFATDFDHDNISIRRFNPERLSEKDLEFILIQNGACYIDKRRLGDLVKTWYDDLTIGGSIIYTLENKRYAGKYGVVTRKRKTENPLEAVIKIMIGSDKNEEPILFLDHFATGNYMSKSIKDWGSDGKQGLFIYGPLLALYTAKKLNINKIVFGDRELEEFAKLVGVQRTTVFGSRLNRATKRDNRKSGVVVLSDNSEGVWGHSIYKQADGRYYTLDYTPLTSDRLYKEFSQIIIPLTSGLESKPNEAKPIRLRESFQVMYTYLRIMEDAFYTTKKFGWAKESYNKLIDSIRLKDPDFILSKVK